MLPRSDRFKQALSRLDLDGDPADFITTSDYTKPARDFAAPRKNLELIPGVQLIQRLESLFEANRYQILVHA